MNSITKKWVRNSLFITMLALIVAEGLFLYLKYSNYYSAALQAVSSRFSSISGQLKMYTGSDLITTSRVDRTDS